jgi:hypothetical protein
MAGLAEAPTSKLHPNNCATPRRLRQLEHHRVGFPGHVQLRRQRPAQRRVHRREQVEEPQQAERVEGRLAALDLPRLLVVAHLGVDRLAPLDGILQVSDEPLVSVDYIGNPASSIVDARSTFSIENRLVKVMACLAAASVPANCPLM